MIENMDSQPGMVWIPGGTFTMGSDHHYAEEAPARPATVGGFWMDVHTVTNDDYARFTRGQMVETLNEDYIRTANAKGVKTNRVLFKHALRAAIVPVITIFGLDFATLLAGTIFTERIFSIDGIGNWGLTALSTPIDINVVSATVLVSSILVVVANLLVDILYSFLDPRVSIA
jgi:peptide/nickel transport system permease protein